MSTLFISDLHLQARHPAMAHGFIHFLQHQAVNAEALYILGDFFEFWIGDDFQTEFETHIMQALKQLTEQGTPVYFMHGNRDFLIGDTFAAETGVTLLSDPTVIDLYGTRTLLMHGDSLCTADTGYMQFRQMVRNPAWQQQILSKSVEERLTLAQSIRQESQQGNSMKADDIMDVTPEEVVNVMAQHHVQQLIHGHTHRPAVHDLVVNQAPAKRWVLGDWSDTQGWKITATEAQWTLEAFQLSTAH